MNSLRQIFKQAKKNNATKGMTWKEYQQYAADRGITDAQLRSGNQDARRLANQFFYGTQPVISQIQGAPIGLESPDIIGPEVSVQLIQQPTTKTVKTITKKQQNNLKKQEATTPTNQRNIGPTGENLKKIITITADPKLEQITTNNNQNISYDPITRTTRPGGIGGWQSNEHNALRNSKIGNLFSWIKVPERLTGNSITGTVVLSPEEVAAISPIFDRDTYTYKQSSPYPLVKHQQGGQVQQSNSQQDAVMQFVQALAQTLQADPNQVIQAAQQNPDALKSAVQVYQQTQDIQQAAQAFSQALQSQAQAAKHGAKLNYLKTLKNQCADDEELVYFKKGGKVDCGCKKKENGGEMKEEKKESAIDKFKKMARGDRFPINKNDTINTATGPKRLVDKKETMKYPKFDHTKATQAEKDRASEKDYYRGDKDHGDHDPVKKDCGGSKMKLKKGDKVCPKCGKVHAAGMGCVVAKFKQRGGQL